ncbi:MAG: hypothetical protein NZ700_03690 [Gemmataceae bacterium]|nr:hypothetical protein [Gemmataceae bacterium]MDW8264247.1 hypothetical protein [Gemmataceae bacterium]
MMQSDCGSRWWLALLLTAGALVDPGQLAAQATADSALPEAVVRAWKEVGAEVGWLGKEQYGFLRFAATKDRLTEAVPGFRVLAWRPGVIAKLPDPGRAFGLALGGTRVTDAGLKELAGLKGLQSLDLLGTRVTDAGLKELAGLKLKELYIPDQARTDLGLKHYLAAVEPPTRLYLSSWRLTDAGLKELAGLKGLQSLDLSETPVTDAGVAELQKALPGCQIYR